MAGVTSGYGLAAGKGAWGQFFSGLAGGLAPIQRALLARYQAHQRASEVEAAGRARQAAAAAQGSGEFLKVLPKLMDQIGKNPEVAPMLIQAVNQQFPAFAEGVEKSAAAKLATITRDKDTARAAAARQSLENIAIKLNSSIAAAEVARLNALDRGATPEEANSLAASVQADIEGAQDDEQRTKLTVAALSRASDIQTGEFLRAVAPGAISEEGSKRVTELARQKQERELETRRRIASLSSRTRLQTADVDLAKAVIASAKGNPMLDVIATMILKDLPPEHRKAAAGKLSASQTTGGFLEQFAQRIQEPLLKRLETRFGVKQSAAGGGESDAEKALRARIEELQRRLKEGKGGSAGTTPPAGGVGQ